MENFIGQIIAFGGNFAPTGWFLCSGQLLPISQYTALFSLLGTTYGGDGMTTFGLPDLRGRVPVGMGQGRGLNEIMQGEMSGTQTNTMLSINMPPHNHTAINPTVNIGVNSGDEQDSDSPVGSYLRQTPGVNTYAGSANAQMGTSPGTISVGIAGGNQPINNIQPTLTINYIIAWEGIYPSRP